jgi:hypothetical protein
MSSLFDSLTHCFSSVSSLVMDVLSLLFRSIPSSKLSPLLPFLQEKFLFLIYPICCTNSTLLSSVLYHHLFFSILAAVLSLSHTLVPSLLLLFSDLCL